MYCMYTMGTDLALLLFEDKFHPLRRQIFRQKRSMSDYQIEIPVPIVMVVKMTELKIYLLVGRPA